MSLVIADSGPESLTLIAAQHEDWIIRQALTLLAASGTTVAEPAPSEDMPTGGAGDMPR